MGNSGLHRFFAPGFDPAGPDLRLTADESHHLLHVLRLGAGDEIAVFDGCGHEVRARVASIDRDGVGARIVEPLAPAREPAVPLVLVQAVLKGDRMDAVVRDATMMGVASIAPVATERALGKASAIDRGRAAERWHRVAVASAKQCRRAVVPSIARCMRLDEWLGEDRGGLRVLLVEPANAGGPAGVSLRDVVHRPRPTSVALVVGPEGGWTHAEQQRAITAGCVPVTLGDITLRADAVALCALAVVRFALGDL